MKSGRFLSLVLCTAILTLSPPKLWASGAVSPDQSLSDGGSYLLLSHTPQGAGDLNGDGYTDVIVPGTTSQYIYYGSRTGLQTGTFVEILPVVSGDGSVNAGGRNIGVCGDINGDGFDDLVIGAPSADAPGYASTDDRGALYFYPGSSGGIATTPAQTVLGAGPGSRLGFQVSRAGDINGDGYADILSVSDPVSTVDQGFLFAGSSSGIGNQLWQVDHHFTSPLVGAGDIDGDGYDDIARNESQNSVNYPEGGVLIYRGRATGPLTTPSWFLNGPSDGQATSTDFGWALAGVGDVDGDGYADLLIGAPHWSVLNTQYNKVWTHGRVALYSGSPTGPTETWAKIGELWDNIGNSVAEIGDVNGDGYADLLVASAKDHPYNYLNPIQDTIPDFVHIYLGGDSGPLATPTYWVEGTQALLPTNWTSFHPAGAGDVDGDGYMDWMMPVDPSTLGIFSGHGDLPNAASQWVINGGASDNARQGAGLSRHGGDINGDGYDDLLVGAPGNFSGKGRANLFLGSSTGLASSPSWAVYGSTVADSVGSRVSILGDVDGDGLPEIAVAAVGAAGHGEVRIYRGASPLPSTTPTWILSGDQAGENFGFSITGVGDVDGDGYADLVVGSPNWDGPSATDAGRAQLYLGGAGGLSTSPAWQLRGDLQASWALTGYDLALGDFNGDGRSDLAVGAPKAGISNFFEGAVGVFLGSVNGFGSQPDASFRGNASFEMVGLTVASAGDVDQDGREDLLIAAPGYSSGTGTPYGRVYLYPGSTSGVSSTASWWRDGQTLPNEQYGRSLTGLGDLDGDGAAEIAISGLAEVVEIFSGIPFSGLQTQPSLTLTPPVSGVEFGRFVGAAGDIDGDGFAELVVGAPDAYQSAFFGTLGTAYLYRGNSAERNNAPRPMVATQSNGSLAASRLFRSTGSLTLRLTSQNSAGRVDHRLQYRLTTTTSNLDLAAVTTVGSWTRSASANFAVSPSGLSPLTPYHWQTRVITRNPLQPWSPWRTSGGWTRSLTMLRPAGTVDRPDLLVTSTSPDTVIVNQPNTLDVVVRNQGLASCPTSRLRVSVDGSVVCDSVSVPYLSAGASTVVPCALPALSGGAHNLQIDLDITDAAIETDETNNTFTSTLYSDLLQYILVRADGNGDVTTIAAAFSAIAPGGLIELADGTFTGAGNYSLDPGGKVFTLRSQSGNASACILDAQASSSAQRRHLTLQNGEGNALRIENITFQGGYYGYGGSVLLKNGVAPVFVGCRFVSNQAGINSGAVNGLGSPSPQFLGCSFIGNTAVTNAGGACTMPGSPVFRDCVFDSNQSAYGGGALYLVDATATVDSCTFTANTSTYHAGAVQISGASTSISSSTFDANSGPAASQLYLLQGAAVTLTNTLVTNGLGGPATVCSSDTPVETLDINCSDLWNNAGGDYTGCAAGQDTDPLRNNISADPQYCAPGVGDLTLLDTSPCAAANNACATDIGRYPVNCFAPPAYLLVKADGSGDVVNIATAFSTIADGGIIELADGTFTGDGNRSLNPGGKMFTLRSQSGNAAACIVDAQGSASVNHRHLTIQNGEGNALRFENITFRGGYSGYGGSVLLGDAVAPIFDGCRFESNQGGVNSGAVHSSGSPSPQFLRCTFSNNTAVGNVGGACTLGGAPVFVGCQFLQNHAVYGGGLYFVNATATVDSCLFANNTANSYSGGIVITGATASATVSRSTFDGGGSPTSSHFYLMQGASLTLSQSLLTNGTGGPAVYCSTDPEVETVDITCSDIWNNAGGDYVGCIAGQDTDPLRDNLNADPYYCDVAQGNYTLDAASPALDIHNACGSTMGAFGTGCTIVAADPLPSAARFALVGAVPNPFNPRTILRFGLETPGRVDLTVYNAAGRVVRHLLRREELRAGSHDALWNGKDDLGQDVSSGVYFARLVSEGRSAMVKMALVR